MTLAQKARYSRVVTLVSYTALLLLLTAWYLVIAPAKGETLG